MITVNSKREFELRDKVDLLQGAALNEKKVKIDENSLKNMDIMVEVAN